MRRSNNVGGIFSGDFAPPVPWRSFGIALRRAGGASGDTDRVVGSLSDQELHWVGRVVAAELALRYAKTLDRKKEKTMVPATANEQ